MAKNKQTIIDSYPLPAYNYKVIIDGVGMSFTEVSGLQIEHEQILYRHGFSWLMGDYLIRGQRKPINVSLKRGIIQQRSFLYDWIKTEQKRDVLIDLCDEEGLPIVSWQINRALPLKLDAPSFNVNSDDVAVESLDLVAHNLTIIHH